MVRETRNSARLKNVQKPSKRESTVTSTPTTTESPVFSSKTSASSFTPPLSEDGGDKQYNSQESEHNNVDVNDVLTGRPKEGRRRSTRISTLGKRTKLEDSEDEVSAPVAKRPSRKASQVFVEVNSVESVKPKESKLKSKRNYKRKRENQEDIMAQTFQDDSASEEEIISEDDLEYNENLDQSGSSDGDDSSFEAEAEDDDYEEESEEEEINNPRKSTCRKKTPKADIELTSEDEEEEFLINYAIELSKQAESMDKNNHAGPSTQSASELRAAAAERRLAASLARNEEECISSNDESSVKGKGKGKGKSPKKKGERVPSRRTAKEILADIRKAAKEKQRKLGRKLTHSERTTIALHYHHPELREVWDKLESRVKPVVPEKAEQPKELKVNLLPFQLESLYWMREQEKGQWAGGMLADEMGMGKTIQTLALISSDSKKPNLIVAPTVAIMQWRNEIEAYTNGLKVAIWHGASREANAKELQKFDIVLTTYAVLESAFRKQENGFKRGGKILKEKSPVHQIKWNRIVLDEAHNIKERATNTAKATFELQSDFKWCLSGTPLQNRVGELYSLVRFLGGDPFSYYFCKQCSCKSLHWLFTDKKSCDVCHHSPMQHTCFWNNEILTPIQKHGMRAVGQEAFKKLRILLDRMMLRRTKIERADDLGLPPRTVIVRRDYFSDEEKELYLSLFSDAKRQFSTYVDQGSLLNNYSNIFSLITRMRQMACHPDLVLKSKQNANKFVTDAGEATICRLCNDIAEDAIQSKCRHIFDRECIKQYIDTAVEQVPTCPVCHISLTIDLDAPALEIDEEHKNVTRQGILGRLDIEKWRSSTKIEALVEELTKLRKKDATTKSLVFSQFVNFLDLIAFRLQRAGFNICRLEGTMSPQARDATIKYFMNNVHVTVFLVSLKAGGVALNLTEASRVYLMDSWWNPAVEFQAMDRIHRLGQYRPVEAIKLVVEDSIESRIVQLQEKKSAMIEATLSTDESAMGRLTPEDLSFLFRL